MDLPGPKVSVEDINLEAVWGEQRAICLSAEKLLHKTMATGEVLAKKLVKTKQDVIDVEDESEANALLLDQHRADHAKAHTTLEKSTL